MRLDDEEPIEAVAAGSWSYQFTEAHEFVSASSEGDWALMTIALRGSQTGGAPAHPGPPQQLGGSAPQTPPWA